MLVSALTLPDIERGAPVAVSGNAPVLDILQPVTEPALADGIRNPVNGIVVADSVILHGSHFDEPGLSCIVNKRGPAAPAVGIAVLKAGSREKQPPGLQVL